MSSTPFAADPLCENTPATRKDSSPLFIEINAPFILEYSFAQLQNHDLKS